jgi:hypothetical protein
MYYCSLYCKRGMGVMQWCSWLRHCATSHKVMGLIPDGVGGTFIDINFLAVLWPWGRLTPNRNVYQEYFLGVKAAGV